MLKKVCLLLRFHPKAATICNKHCPSVAHIRSYNMVSSRDYEVSSLPTRVY